MNCGETYSKLVTSRKRFCWPANSAGIGSRPAKSLLKPNWPRCAAPLCLVTSNFGASGKTGSPQLITTAWEYPSATTTASSLLGATELKFMPGGVFAGGADDVGVAAGCSSVAQAANTEPAPTASTAIAPVCSIERRDTALTMSPKYSLSLVLRTGLEHASPHL